MWINGEAWGPAYTPRDQIREGGTRAFSHSANLLYFALPNGVTNSANLEATATYTVKIRARVLVALASAAAMLIWLRIFLAHCAGELVGFVYRWRVVTHLLKGASWVVIVASAFYAGSIVYGFVAGDRD